MTPLPASPSSTGSLRDGVQNRSNVEKNNWEITAGLFGSEEEGSFRGVVEPHRNDAGAQRGGGWVRADSPMPPMKSSARTPGIRRAASRPDRCRWTERPSANVNPIWSG